ncbi:MAG: aldo/keto reductase [Hymenobacter sp.]
MATLAQAHAVSGPIAMQLEYSLVERTIEREYVPAARALGLGVVPWSPLAGGFLAGKYQRAAQGTQPASGEGRLSGSNPFSGPFTKFTERNWAILAALRSVVRATGPAAGPGGLGVGGGPAGHHSTHYRSQPGRTGAR